MKRAAQDIVAESISSGKKIRIPVHSLDMRPDIKQILSEILKHFSCEELLVPLYTCLMELLNNAVKANYKNIYFENYNPEKKGSIDYPTALKLFKLEIGRKEHVLQRMADDRKLTADVIFRILDDALHVSVVNYIHMTADEYRNVMHKFETAKICRNLTEYFIRNEHDPFREGAGLGLVLVIMILKSLGLDSSRLTINSDTETTIASLLIPLNEITLRSYREMLMDSDQRA
jgi:hypothetical protein